MTTKSLLGWIAAGLILGGAPQVAGAAGQVNLGVVNWIGYGPLYCAGRQRVLPQVRRGRKARHVQ